MKKKTQKKKTKKIKSKIKKIKIQDTDRWHHQKTLTPI